MEFGETVIGEIHVKGKSRDDISTALKGIQHMYKIPQLHQRIFALLTEQIRPGINLKIRQPGMDLWRILVLAVLKQGLGSDYDRLQEIANQ